MQGLQARESGVSASITGRLSGLDWAAIGASLDEWGYARTPALLTSAECAELRGLYADGTRFKIGRASCRERV